MNRRMRSLLALLAAGLIGSACTTFSDNDAVARVDDVELTTDELDHLVPIVDPRYTPPEGDDQARADLAEIAAADAEAQRAAIGLWIEARVLTDAVADAGIELDEGARDAATGELAARFPTFSSLSDENRDLLVDYVVMLDVLPTLRQPDAVVAAWFDAGAASSGLACVSHILVETRGEAEDLLAELDEGADFAQLAQERSIDPGSAVNGGFLACDTDANLSRQFVPEFAAATVAAVPGEPSEPVETEFGFHVIRLGTFAESGPQLVAFFDSGFIAANVAIAQADSYVDPRYGFARGAAVLPLG